MDFRLAFAGVVVAGGAIGIAMPDGFGDRIVAPESETVLVAAPTSTASTMSPSDQGFADSLTLERAADGHFYADVSVAGQSARMLVDTGASVIALTGEDAAAMGLSWDETEVAEVARGASGPVMGVPTVLPLVELGSFAAEDVPAIIIPEGLFVSLLGQSFLSKIGKVEMAEDTLVMSDQ